MEVICTKFGKCKEKCNGYGWIERIIKKNGYQYEYVRKCDIWSNDLAKNALKRQLAETGRSRMEIKTFEEILKVFPDLNKIANRVKSILTREESLFYLCSPNGTGKTILLHALYLLARKKGFSAIYCTADQLQGWLRLEVAGSDEEKEEALKKLGEVRNNNLVAIDDIDHCLLTENFARGIEPLSDNVGFRKIVIAGNKSLDKLQIGDGPWLRDRFKRSLTITWDGESHRNPGNRS